MCLKSQSKIEEDKKEIVFLHNVMSIISSDRSSCTDDGLLYIYPQWQLFQILSIYAFLYCYKCHSKSLKQYQCNWCHRISWGYFGDIFGIFLEYFGIFWNILEYFGIFWNILEYIPVPPVSPVLPVLFIIWRLKGFFSLVINTLVLFISLLTVLKLNFHPICRPCFLL